MNEAIEAASRLAALSPMTLPVVIKATAFLLVALLLTTALRRAPASARHAIWQLALAGLIAIPVLSHILPQWRLPVPGTLAALVSGTRLAALAHPESRTPVIDSLATAPSEFALHAQTSFTPAPTGATEPVISAPPARLRLGDFVALVWGAGVLCILGWLALGHLWLGRVRRRSTVVSDASWLSSVRELSARLKLRRVVKVLSSDAAVIPAACGLLRPALLLPTSANEWPEAHRQSVLCHELAHVKRLDCITQLVAQLACALFWFHPGAWYAARRLLAEREHACDDMVLLLGTRPSDYASHLLEMARTLTPATLSAPATVSMARRSQLEGRLLAVLDPRRRRGGTSRSVGRAPALAMLAIALPLVAVEADGMQLPAPPTQRVSQGVPAPPASPMVPAPAASTPSTLASAEHRMRALVDSGDCAVSAEQTLILPVADARRLEVHASAGALFVEGRPESSRIRVLGIACATRVRDLDEIRLRPDRDRESLEVETHIGRHARGAKLHLLVELPVGMAVDVDDSEGDVEIRDVGRLRVEDGSGKLYVERARGDVRVKDGAGDVDIRDVEGNVKVTEDKGGELRVAGIHGNFEVEHRGSDLVDWLDVAGEIRVPRVHR